MGSAAPALKPLSLSPKTLALWRKERQYVAGGFEPFPAFFVRGQGAKLWDVDDKEYIDFISMFSASNFGHSHPVLTAAVIKQINTLPLANLSTHNAYYPDFAENMCQRFGFDRMLAMTSGTEAADTACKIARKWGIAVKGISAEECLILGVGQAYHGMGSGVWGLMDSSKNRKEYGLDSRFVMNVNPSTGENLEYLDLGAMERCLAEHGARVAGVIMECLHVTSRTVEEEMVYAKGVWELCRKYHCVFIADEVRQGAGKTGRFLGYEHCEGLEPDLVLMGKSITGGYYPQSFVMGKKRVMDLVGSYQMASTFGFTPLAIAAATAAVQVIDEENLMERAIELGTKWRAIVDGWKHPKVDYNSSIGADANLYVKGVSGPRLTALCIHKGLFIYPRPNGLRISFPLVMTDEELEKGAAVIKEALDEVDLYGEIPGEDFYMSI